MHGEALGVFVDKLAGMLIKHEISVGPEQIIDAHQIVVMLLAEHGGTIDDSDLRNALGPIFCADPAELAAFGRYFADLQEETQQELPEPTPEPEPQPERKSAAKKPAIVRDWVWARSLAMVLTFVALMIVASWAIFTFTPAPIVDSTAQPSPVEVSSGSVPTVTGSGGAGTASESSDLHFQPPPRPPAPVVLLRSDQPQIIAALMWVIISIPMIGGIAVLMRNIAGHRVFLSAQKSRSHPDLKSVLIANAKAGPFAFSRLAPSVRRLRQPRRQEVRRLDARKSIDKTVRAGGYPNLVFETRSKRPGYVLLIERRNAFDFFAHAAKSLADFLHEAGLEVYAFAFSGRPYRLTPLWRKGHKVAYQEIVQRYHGDALIVAGDPATIRRGNVSGANVWRPDTTAWSAMALLSANASETWSHEEDWFHEQSFSVAAFGSCGFDNISAWLASDDKYGMEPRFIWEPNIGSLFPRLLADEEERWLDDHEDPEIAELLEQLEAYLGKDGMLLIAAIAAYPELRWPIARFLNEELFPDDGDSLEAEERLVRIARLPWCREGKMPAYIRLRLMNQLSGAQREHVQSTYYSLLNETHRASSGGPTVEIADPGSKSLLEFVRQMLFSAPPGPYRDYIFQSVMLDKPKDMLGIEMENRRARQIGKKRWREAIPDVLRLGRRTAIATLGIGFLTFVFFEPWFTGALEWRNTKENASITTRLIYVPDSNVAAGIESVRPTRFLAERLRWALEARGFTVAMEAVTPPAEQLKSAAAPETVPLPEILTSGRVNPLSRPVASNFVRYNDATGVSSIDQTVVTNRDTFFGQASTPMSEFSIVVAGLIEHATYDQPVSRIGYDDSVSWADALETFMRGYSMTVDDGEIIVLLAEDSRSFQDRLAKGGLGPVMTLVAPGTLTRQASQAEQQSNAQSQVSSFERPFAIGKYEMTFAEYDRFAIDTGRDLPDDVGWGRDYRPVINVTKADAEAFAEWLSKQTGETYRLPSDSEWEYAARAGVAQADSAPSRAEANFSFGTSPDRTIAIGSRQANAWGLHDTLGNVAEWVSDCWNPSPGSQGGRVDRGGECFSDTIRNGSWQDNPDEISLATNRSVNKGTASNTIGFRLVREVPLSRDHQPARSATVDPGYEEEEFQEAANE